MVTRKNTVHPWSSLGFLEEAHEVEVITDLGEEEIIPFNYLLHESPKVGDNIEVEVQYGRFSKLPYLSPLLSGLPPLPSPPNEELIASQKSRTESLVVRKLYLAACGQTSSQAAYFFCEW